MNINNAVILVTGGAHRVGKAIAMALAREGACIAFTYNSSEAAARQTQSEIEALGTRALAIRCDQADLAQIRSAVETSIERFGRIDGLVNSASIMQEVTFLNTTLEDWDLTMNINARGPYFFMQIVGKWMLDHGGGSIVNIIDESAVAPGPGALHHAASKAALWMLTRACALELAPSIRVNAVLPGAVLKPPHWDEERWQSIAEVTPLKKLGTAEDVARACVYLMKEDFITGQDIVVDGGRTVASR